MAGSLRKVTVILGAGASADAWNETGPPADQEWRPPLANELFGHRPAFWEVLKRYQGARVLATDLGEQARTGSLKLEARLREFATHPDTGIRAHFKHVPPYLRDLLNAVVRNYTEGHSPGTHLRFVLRLLSAGVQVGFVVLNYDDYVEMALREFDTTLNIDSLDHYVALQRRALVFKVHGSVDWGIAIAERRNVPSWDIALQKYEPQANASASIVLDKSREPSREWQTQRVDGELCWLYPCLTAPLAGKGELDLVCPPRMWPP
jgi:hypothetical protein